MGIMASILGGAATSATAATATTAGTAATTAGTMGLSAAANSGWQPNSFLDSMNFGDSGYQATTSFGGATPANTGSPVFAPEGFEEQNAAPQASLGNAGNASIQNAPGISAGFSLPTQSLLGDVSMNAGLSGMLGQEAIGSIASTASKFQNKIAKVPGFEI